MIKKKKKRRLRAEIKMYVVLFSLLASILTMMSIHKTDPNVVLVTSGGATQTKSIVVLDPGHGGFDPGCEFEGVYEKDIALRIAKITGDNLRSKGIEVIYTREEDVALGEYEESDLQSRIDIAITSKAMYFASFHMNESPSSERSYGFEVFANSNNVQSSNLAQQVTNNLDALGYTQKRAILEGDSLQVIAKNPVPAVLIEMGFMSDEQDRAYLLSNTGQQRIGSAIADAIYTSIQAY